jgi:hypothetical protein
MTTSTELVVPTRIIPAGTASAYAEQAGLVRPRLVSPVSVLLAAASPAVTLPMLALSRYWSEHGARHSIGDMVPLALGGVIAMAGAGLVDGDPVLTGTCIAAAGSCLAVGAMAYPAGLVEPVIATLMATVAGWVFTRRVARTTKAAAAEYADRQAERDTTRDVAVINGQTALGVATIRGETRIQVAQINGQAALGVADRNVLAATGGHGFRVEQLDDAWAHRRALEPAPAAPVDDLYGLAACLGLEQRR